jgi:hypothetical protein
MDKVHAGIGTSQAEGVGKTRAIWRFQSAYLIASGLLPAPLLLLP